jgi:predicted nuclease of predicted toxin-antitoxin system
MKVLLDENLPLDLRHLLLGHDVFTADYMGWKGLENGDLLAAAAEQGFDVVISKDSGIEHQHNQEKLPTSVLLLRAATNKIDDLRPLVSAVLDALSTLRPRSLVRVPG